MMDTDADAAVNDSTGGISSVVWTSEALDSLDEDAAVELCEEQGIEWESMSSIVELQNALAGHFGVEATHEAVVPQAYTSGVPDGVVPLNRESISSEPSEGVDVNDTKPTTISQLQAFRVRELERDALNRGIRQLEIDEALDGDTPKQTLIALICRALADTHSADESQRQPQPGTDSQTVDAAEQERGRLAAEKAADQAEQERLAAEAEATRVTNEKAEIAAQKTAGAAAEAERKALADAARLTADAEAAHIAAQQAEQAAEAVTKIASVRRGRRDRARVAILKADKTAEDARKAAVEQEAHLAQAKAKAEAQAATQAEEEAVAAAQAEHERLATERLITAQSEAQGRLAAEQAQGRLAAEQAEQHLTGEREARERLAGGQAERLKAQTEAQGRLERAEDVRVAAGLDSSEPHVATAGSGQKHAAAPTVATSRAAAFLGERVYPTLRIGLQALDAARPDNPVGFLAAFLSSPERHMAPYQPRAPADGEASMLSYCHASVRTELARGLQAVNVARPEDPVGYLASFLSEIATEQ